MLAYIFVEGGERTLGVSFIGFYLAQATSDKATQPSYGKYDFIGKLTFLAHTQTLQILYCFKYSLTSTGVLIQGNQIHFN